MNTFQRIIDTVSDAFSILDFSYTLSGGATFAVILSYWHYVCKGNIEWIKEYNWIYVVAGILFAIYLLGIFSWSIGKWIRKKLLSCTIKPTFEELFESTVKTIRKEDESWNIPLEKDSSLSYELMWIELGRMEEAAERYKFIQRFWVMQAAYEGLVFSCTLAVIATLSAGCKEHLGILHVCLGTVLFIIGAICCLYEAKSCAETQIKEVILSYYTHTKK